MTRHRISSMLSALVLLSAAGAGAPAQAEETSQIVRYADLDLARPEGIAQLNHRIKNAIDQVCGDADTHDLAQAQYVSRCRRIAMASTTTQIAAAIDKAQQLAMRLSADTKVASR